MKLAYLLIGIIATGLGAIGVVFLRKVQNVFTHG